MKGLSIVVVTWNCAAFIERFVRELEASLLTLDDREVLILDNASTDGTADILEGLLPNRFHLLRSKENLGFARANNILLRQANYDRIALLNPDVFDYPEGFWEKVELARIHEGADVAFVKLRNSDGSFQDCVGEFPSPRRALNSLTGCGKQWSKVAQPARVEVGIMAFMLTTRNCFQVVGLIDEDFHMYCEDVDWCWRAAQSGKVVVYFPELSLTHIGGASASKRWGDLVKQQIKLKSELLFVRKRYHGWLKGATRAITWSKLALNQLRIVVNTIQITRKS